MSIGLQHNPVKQLAGCFFGQGVCPEAPLPSRANDHGKANQCDTQRPADQPINIG
jgi:hypothetical protein